MKSVKLLLTTLLLHILSSTCVVFAGFDALINLTDFTNLRQKRSLIFQGSGTLKFVIGPSIPVNFGDPIAWRSMVCSYNIHGGQYPLPTTPIYPWDKWEDTFARSLKKMRAKFDYYGEYHADDSRLFVYTAFENYMNNQQSDGRACLLRSICQNAQIAHHIGIFSEILNVVLTPGKENLTESYRASLEAGKSGVDCLKLYPTCPLGVNILDQYINEF